MGSVYFRFKGGSTLNSIDFDGEFITVSELTRIIASRFNIQVGNPIKELTLIDCEHTVLNGETRKIVSNSIVTVSKAQKSNDEFCNIGEDN